MNKHKKSLLIIGILLSISLIISASYAYYIFSISQIGSNVVRSDCFRIDYSDNGALNLSDTIPLSDDDIDDIDAYTFTIENICNSPAKYDINIETLNTSDIDLNAIRYKLDNYSSYILGSIDNNDTSVIVNKTIASSSKTINSGFLEIGEEKTFNLKLWIDEDSTKEQSANKTFSSKVVINSTAEPNYKSAYLVDGIIFNEKIKKLLNPNATYESQSSSITAFERSNSAPGDGVSYVDLADSTSKNPFLVWNDNGTIYYYTQANRIYFNTNASYSFYNLKGLLALDLSDFDTSRSTDLNHMFNSMNSLESLNLGDNFDISLVTNTSEMFDGLSVLSELDLGEKFDTSNVTDMSFMFTGMKQLLELDLGDKFDTSKVTDMRHMFNSINKCSKLNLGDKFDTSKVEDMSFMFNGLNEFRGDNVLDLGDKFDTSNVVDMSNMFSYYHARYLNLGEKFYTSKVTSMRGMFSGSYVLRTLDLSTFDTSNVTDMNSMFNNLTAATSIYVSDKFVTSDETSSENMFYNTINLVGGSGTTYIADHINKEYARIDDPANGKPGYFTLKTN